MVKSRKCISHITRFITSTGHGAPAIIPVRRLVRSKFLNSGRPKSASDIAGHAIEGGRALRLYRLESSARIEGPIGQDDRSSACQRRHSANYASKAVVHRQRNADTIPL